jgi:hypothetical protein
LRRLAEIARLLHRENDAMRGAGRDLSQVAMQSYYDVSSLQLFLVLHSKQISKTANTRQAVAKHPLCRHESLLLRDLCQKLLRRARNALLKLLEAFNATAEALATCLRFFRTKTKDTSEHPYHGTFPTRERTSPLPSKHCAKTTEASRPWAQNTPAKPKSTPPRRPKHQDPRKVAQHHDRASALEFLALEQADPNAPSHFPQHNLRQRQQTYKTKAQPATCRNLLSGRRPVRMFTLKNLESLHAWLKVQRRQRKGRQNTEQSTKSVCLGQRVAKADSFRQHGCTRPEG